MDKKRIKLITVLITIILAIIYYILYIKSAFNHINYMYEIINASILLIVLFIIGLLICGNKTLRNIISYILPIIIIMFIIFNILVYKNIINIPSNLVMIDLKDTSLIDAMKWTTDNNISLNTSYEYSDNIKEGNIITQSINPNTLLKGIDEISVVVSSGPNYDKELILSSMIDMDIDSLVKFINDNHLNNVTINYETSDSKKDTVINQNTMGNIKRNTGLVFTISLGKDSDLKELELDDLKNKKEFDATLYLKQNGISYEISYEFSDSVKKEYVISHEPTSKSKVTPRKDTVKLVISKGKEIKIPEFKTLDEVISFVNNNNLKISFDEKYDINIDKGKLISINFQVNEIIAEGTKIIATISKGPLLLPSLTSLNEFMVWVNTYGIRHEENYEFNDSIGRGNIISISKKQGDKIDPERDVLIAKVSYGSAVTIPNVIGKSKGEISSICSNIGLSCGFYYTGYSSTPNDVATQQSISAGNKVVGGTYMNIGLSNGPAQTFNFYIQAEWFETSADSTINVLRNKLTSGCPGVNFIFEKHADNSSPNGIIHPNSPTKGGDNNFTQGNTYTIWVVG